MQVVRRLKDTLGGLSASAPLSWAFRPLMRDRATIFVLHRFLDPEFGVGGHSPGFLRRALAYLRRHNLHIIPLMELIHRARQGEPIGEMVAFTVDDGYGDFHRVGGPMFAAMDCPVTVFLTTGFMDRPSWHWWDRLRFVLEERAEGTATLDLETGPFSGSWHDSRSRRSLRHRLVARFEGMAPEEIDDALLRLEAALGVQVPSELPERFAPMTWDQVRENAARGVTFGPHTVSHRNLGTISPFEAEREILLSWDRVRGETTEAIPVFCYPFGGRAALLPGAEAVLSRCGLEAAVTTIPGYISTQNVKEGPFSLPRFSWESSLSPIRQVVSGVEQAKDLFLAGRKRREYSPERR